MPKVKKIMKIAVAMSGGVDSSVVAAILKDQGHDVFGVFFHLGGQKCASGFRENICCSLEAQEDARRVAQQLDIPFYTLNVSEMFESAIVDDFVNEYAAGKTPNPCVRCNRLIKFGEAMDRVIAMGAEFMATGHYAKVTIAIDHNDTFHLYKSNDPAKDQTYFLAQLNQTQLSHVMFPLSELTKPEVRKLAKKYKLATASKKESQEVCFVPKDGLTDFLKEHIPMKPGKIFDVVTGEAVGEHQGLLGFTIGQRKGLGMAGGPWFVKSLDVENNILWVTTNLDLIKSNIVLVENLNWISGQEPKAENLTVKVRYHADEVSITSFEKQNNIYKFELASPQLSVTPGQTAVFYAGDECVGGGTII